VNVAPILLISLLLLLIRWAAQLWLEKINRQHAALHAGAVPAAFADHVDPRTYGRSVEYTLARSRFSDAETTWSTAILLAVLFSGLLPWSFRVFADAWGPGAGSMAAFVICAGLVLSLPSLPFDWYAQFVLEERFGFNTTTPRLWWSDRAKGLLLALLLGYPLLVLILKLVEWTGNQWWLWAWATLMLFQLLMLVLAPLLILPLFNKLTPLPQGELRERLLNLGKRTGFHAQNILVMDGSKRSRHSNAFFTGFGRFRKIVLFDTLIEQLDGTELEAVVAHEIGHYRKRHIPKLIASSAASSLLGFAFIAWLAGQEAFYAAFGFQPGHIVPALLLFALLSGTVTFWLSPLTNRLSRRFEYQADAYARNAMRSPAPLVGALRKLNEKNLSNLIPHPLYSRFYYSHPTLLEREQALHAPAP
jgi:STE24 endopeptidase